MTCSDPTAAPASRVSPRIVVVGSINADLVVHVARHPSPGETLHGSGGELLPGGKGANQAVAAALLGGDVTMVGAVGTDPQAEAALSGLRGSGANLAHVRHVEGATGLAVVTVAEDGENAIIVVPGANGTVDRAFVEGDAELIGGSDILILQGEIPRSGIEEATRLMRDSGGGRLILNPAPVLDLDQAVIRQADPLVVNEHEAELVLAQFEGPRHSSAAVSATSDPRATPEQLITRLHAHGVRSVVLTLGSAGALILDGHDPEERSSRTPVPVPAASVKAVDTTGAGDSFIGALAVRLAAGESLETAARFAARVSAFAVQGAGAQPSYARVGDELPTLP